MNTWGWNRWMMGAEVPSGSKITLQLPVTQRGHALDYLYSGSEGWTCSDSLVEPLVAVRGTAGLNSKCWRSQIDHTDRSDQRLWFLSAVPGQHQDIQRQTRQRLRRPPAERGTHSNCPLIRPISCSLDCIAELLMVGTVLRTEEQRREKKGDVLTLQVDNRWERGPDILQLTDSKAWWEMKSDECETPALTRHNRPAVHLLNSSLSEIHVTDPN